MEYKARTGSKLLYLCHHQLVFHLLLLLLASSPSTTAQSDDVPINPRNPVAGLEDSSFFTHNSDSNFQPITANSNDPLPTTTSPDDQQPSEGNRKQCPAELQCQCPVACECPESKYLNQIKDDLAPFIRQQFRELLKKALGVAHN